MAMAQLEPAVVYPEYTFGKVCATIANSMLRRRRAKGWTVADFFSLDHSSTKEQSEDQMIAILEKISEVSGKQRGAVVRRRKR